MKKQRFLILFLAAALAMTLAACGSQPAQEEPAEEGEAQTGQTQPEETETAPASEEDAVAQALLDRAQSGYRAGECPAEGHAILRTDDSQEGTLVVYAQCSVGNYSFISGNFEEVSGSGAIPSRLTFTKDENGGLTLTDFWEAEDGSRYEASIRETFPEDLVGQAMDTESYYPDLQAQKEAYAKAHLEELGREAEIGEYADFDHPLAADQGMSVEVSNALSGLDELLKYPFFLGNEERIEDGVRWVYSSEWTPGETDGEGTAVFTKTNYDTGEIAEQHVYQVTGDAYTEVAGEPS